MIKIYNAKKILSIIPGKDYIKTYKFDNQSLK